MRWIFLAAILAASAPSAWAGLGDSGKERVARPGERAIQRAPVAGTAYVELQTTLPSGTVVREFADASGAVFAVSWSGPFLPNLRELLGPHFRALEASQGRAARGARKVVRQPGLVIESAGRMGGFEGSAWIPGRLPPGFLPEHLHPVAP